MKNNMGIWHYIKSYRFNSIFIKNFLLIMFLIFLPLAGISITVFNFFNQITRDEAGLSNQSAVSRVRDMVDMIITETDRISVRIASDLQVEDLLQSYIPDFAGYEVIEKINNINKQIGVSTITSDYIDSIYVYSERNDFILSTNESNSRLAHFFDTDWKKVYDDNKDRAKSWFSFRRFEERFNGVFHNYISSFWMIPIYKDRKLGAVIINIDADKLGKLINSYNAYDYNGIYIMDADNTLLYCSDFSNIGQKADDMDILRDVDIGDTELPVTKVFDGMQVSIAFAKSKYNDWKYVSVVPLQQLQKKTQTLKGFMIVSITISIVILMLVAFFISIHVFTPIKNIISIIENPGSWSNLNQEKGNKQNYNELKYIINNLMASFDEGKKMEEELEYRLNLLKKAQAIALQSQINPHFLFNTLETVNWMAINLTKGSNEVSKIITAFSQLLRISFSTQEHLIFIHKEIEHAKRYVEIQMVRYSDKLHVCWEVDEEILNFKTVKIVLQPLIENAIYHGIKPKEGEGTIWIKGYMEEENIVLAVVDDGVGTTEENIAALNLSMHKDYIKEDQHIGLSNVNQRIKLIFGDPYGVRIESAPGQGAVVKIIIPKVTITDTEILNNR